MTNYPYIFSILKFMPDVTIRLHVLYLQILSTFFLLVVLHTVMANHPHTCDGKYQQ